MDRESIVTKFVFYIVLIIFSTMIISPITSNIADWISAQTENQRIMNKDLERSNQILADYARIEHERKMKLFGR